MRISISGDEAAKSNIKSQRSRISALNKQKDRLLAVRRKLREKHTEEKKKYEKQSESLALKISTLNRAIEGAKTRIARSKQEVDSK